MPANDQVANLSHRQAAAVEKLNAINRLIIALEEEESTDSLRLNNFREVYHSKAPILMKHRDSEAVRVIKFIAAVLLTVVTVGICSPVSIQHIQIARETRSYQIAGSVTRYESCCKSLSYHFSCSVTWLNLFESKNQPWFNPGS